MTYRDFNLLFPKFIIVSWCTFGAALYISITSILYSWIIFQSHFKKLEVASLFSLLNTTVVWVKSLLKILLQSLLIQKTFKLSSLQSLQTLTVKNSAISPNFLVGKFCGKAQFRIVSGTSPETMRKLCLSTKFLHQEIRWN